MSISTINSISFKGNSQQTNSNQKAKKTGGIVPAVGSFFIPGLGQFINGNNEAGFKFLAKHIALMALYKLSMLADYIGVRKSSSALIIASFIGSIISTIANLTLRISSAENAYKGKKAESNNQTENKVDTQA